MSLVEGPQVVLWNRDGHWCASKYDGAGPKLGKTVDLGVPGASEFGARERAAAEFHVDPLSVALIDPTVVVAGPRS